MDINNLQGTLPHSYRIDADKIRQRLQQEDKDYETHSRFMVTNMQIWSELQEFQAQTVYHFGSSVKETAAVKRQSTDVGEQAYCAFTDAISEKNNTTAGNNLNSIWKFYTKMKQ